MSTRGALRIPLVGYYITQLQTLSSDALQLCGGQQWYHLDYYLLAREQHYGSNRYGSEMSCAENHWEHGGSDEVFKLTKRHKWVHLLLLGIVSCPIKMTTTDGWIDAT